MLHQEASVLAGKTVKIKTTAMELGGQEIRVEDWWDRVSGKSWMVSNGNPACMNYAMRSGCSSVPVPTDDEVIYGKIGYLGYLVHTSELEI